MLVDSLDGAGEFLSSPLSNHLIAYNPSLSTEKPAEGISARIASNRRIAVETKVSANPVIVQVAGTGVEASLGLNQSVSLTGNENGPGTPEDSNSPGLNNEGEGILTKMKSSWVMFALIFLVIAGLIYYFNPGNVLGR